MDNKTARMSKKMVNNAHKVGFVCQQYPEKTLPQMLDLLGMPAIDINSALWAAEDLGLIAKPDRETGKLQFLAEPDDGWDFGESVNDLKTALVYCLGVMARDEKDLEEFFLSKWTGGYNIMDVLVAMKWLLVNGRIAEYEVQDHRRDDKGNPMYGEDENTPLMDTYIFYTLPENLGKEWGRKSFKDGAAPKEA